MSKNKFWIPLTYKPKITGVLAGTIRQTIRAGSSYAAGNEIAFHGWAGVPYRSPWSFRTPYYRLVEVIDVEIMPFGLVFPKTKAWGRWTDLDNLARLDGIEPATGEELGNVLKGYHGVPAEGIWGQILRW